MCRTGYRLEIGDRTMTTPVDLFGAIRSDSACESMEHLVQFVENEPGVSGRASVCRFTSVEHHDVYARRGQKPRDDRARDATADYGNVTTRVLIQRRKSRRQTVAKGPEGAR